VISGRIGITDAEVLVKKFTPTFDVEDLTKMGNYQAIASLMVNNVPSAPFSMSFIPPMGEINGQLSDALKRLSAAKYGRPRSQVEKEIFERLGSGKVRSEPAKPSSQSASKPISSSATATSTPKSTAGSSFLDEWLSKRKQLNTAASVTQAAAPLSPTPFAPPAQQSPAQPSQPLSLVPPQQSVGQNPFAQPTVPQPPIQAGETIQQPQVSEAPSAPQHPPVSNDSLHLRGDTKNHDDEISIKLR
jgi:hypothetical protein